MSRTLFGLQILFQSASYPNVIILVFSSPLTFGSHSGQNELDSVWVQVPRADPPRPCTKTILVGVTPLLSVDEVGSMRTVSPN